MTTGGTPIKPFLAKDLSLLGLPEIAPEDRPRRAVELLGEMTEQIRSLRLFMDSCSKCGACAEQCHSYLGPQHPNNIPAAPLPPFPFSRLSPRLPPPAVLPFPLVPPIPDVGPRLAVLPLAAAR